MTTHAARLLRDQNLDVHFNGGGTIGGKPNVTKVQKNGGRKALQDLSNSAKPSDIPSSMKKNSLNNVLKIHEKNQAGGRKALRDLTNSVNRPKKIQDVDNKKKKNLVAYTDEENFPKDIAGERFLHNHQECVKARTKNFDLKTFLNVVGLVNEDNFTPFASSRALTIPKPEMEEKIVAELMMEEYEFKKKTEFLVPSEPNSPTSPKSPNSLMDLDKDYNFILMESP